jgi:hypothetical protein
MEKLDDNRTRTTFDFYLKNSFVLLTLFRLFMKKKYEKGMQRSLENLAQLVKEVKLPAPV